MFLEILTAESSLSGLDNIIIHWTIGWLPIASRDIPIGVFCVNQMELYMSVSVSLQMLHVLCEHIPV